MDTRKDNKFDFIKIIQARIRGTNSFNKRQIINYGYVQKKGNENSGENEKLNIKKQRKWDQVKEERKHKDLLTNHAAN
jgi:hypothetical protein